jgi:protein-tyrosine phosphatase
MRDLASTARTAVSMTRLAARRWWLRTARPEVFDSESLEFRLAGEPNILFLCHGNICRSPLAERYLRRQVRRLDDVDAAVASAGLSTHAGKGSPEKAIRAAEEVGVSLLDHRATPLQAEALQWSDAVFVMDVPNYLRVRQQFGDWDDRTYFLATLRDDGPDELHDPYGGELPAYRRRYDEIVQAVDALVDELHSVQGKQGGYASQPANAEQ